MSKFVVAAALALLCGCKKEPPPPPAPPISPGEVNVEGALHAVGCGAVTAIWTGNAEMLKDLPQPAPKSFAVESLSFKFADGTTKAFTQSGQVLAEDWRFNVFSPDCSMVALLTDHYGPYHVVKTADLRGYLEGRVKPVEVQSKNATAQVHGELVWRDATAFEFAGFCCGGAEIFKANTKDGSLERIAFIASAPHGIRRVGTKWEAAP
ncbi:MAG: hypothetical protein QM817_29395 [Archangium sp.]